MLLILYKLLSVNICQKRKKIRRPLHHWLGYCCCLRGLEVDESGRWIKAGTKLGDVKRENNNNGLFCRWEIIWLGRNWWWVYAKKAGVQSTQTRYPSNALEISQPSMLPWISVAPYPPEEAPYLQVPLKTTRENSFLAPKYPRTPAKKKLSILLSKHVGKSSHFARIWMRWKAAGVWKTAKFMFRQRKISWSSLKSSQPFNFAMLLFVLFEEKNVRISSGNWDEKGINK